MTKRVVGVSPDGMVQYHKYEHHTDTHYRIYEQDVEADREYCKALQNDPESSRRGIKQEWWQTAHYSAVDCMEMMKKFGVSPVTNPAEALKIAKVHMPWCLTVPKESLEKKPKIIIAK